jgi:CubicO group peptidase (beta-lactamase class C family)
MEKGSDMKLAHVIIALTGLIAADRAAAAPGPVPMSAARAAAIDRVVTAGMARTGAKGLALAVVEDGKVVLVRTWGIRNAAGAPLRPDTIVYGASITKAVFAYAVMRLVDEGRIALDRPIAALLPKPLPDYGNVGHYGNWGDLAGDQRWRLVTPRMALTHSTGFANFAFVEPDGKLRFHFDPGTRYAYSGEGLMLLQFAIDQAFGHSFEEEAQRLVFRPLGMRDTSLKWRDDFAGRLADGWQLDGKTVAHERRDHARVAGSMDTSIADLARFAAAIVGGTGLTERAHAEMLRPQRPITTAAQFPTLQPELPPGRRRSDLSAALGVVTFSGPQGPGFYKGGHDEQTGNTMVCVRRGRRCALLMSNDVRAERLFPELVRTILGETGAPWRWEYPDQFSK